MSAGGEGGGADVVGQQNEFVAAAALLRNEAAHLREASGTDPTAISQAESKEAQAEDLIKRAEELNIVRDVDVLIAQATAAQTLNSKLYYLAEDEGMEFSPEKRVVSLTGRGGTEVESWDFRSGLIAGDAPFSTEANATIEGAMWDVKATAASRNEALEHYIEDLEHTRSELFYRIAHT